MKVNERFYKDLSDICLNHGLKQIAPAREDLSAGPEFQLKGTPFGTLTVHLFPTWIAIRVEECRKFLKVIGTKATGGHKGTFYPNWRAKPGEWEPYMPPKDFNPLNGKWNLHSNETKPAFIRADLLGQLDERLSLFKKLCGGDPQTGPYEVEIRATIIKRIRVESAKDEQDAIEQAHQLFSPLNDGTAEKYEEECLGVKNVGTDALDIVLLK